jgi:adenylate cyclase
MAKEIERKFLLVEGASIPIPAIYKNFYIKQGYIHGDKDKNVRIRLTTDKAVLGLKFTDEAITDEFEYKIPKEDGRAIYAKTTNRVEKKRLSFNRNKVHYDVDSYPNGIIIVEVEFKSIHQMALWEKPSWIGDEVTGFEQYSNVVMAKQNLTFKKDV